MQAYNSELFLTTSDVADLFQVHPSTVKRWCDGEGLVARKTEGGHRRIYLRNALEFAGERGIETFLDPFAPFESHVWLAVRSAVDAHDFGKVRSLAMGWLLRGYPGRITSLFREMGSHPDLPFELLCDLGVQRFMADVGEAWAQGRLRIGEEHMASQAVMEALVHLSPGSPMTSEARAVAIVGATEGNRHQVGSMCVRVLLELEGWMVFYPGSDTPAEDFAALQRERGAELVCVSVSSPASAAHLHRAVRVLGEFYDAEHPYDLAFGGEGVDGGWTPDEDLPFRETQTFPSVSEFIRWVRENRNRWQGRPAPARTLVGSGASREGGRT